MPKQISPLDLLTKISLNSFLIETKNESLLVIPGVFFEMPGKFFTYYDVVDATLKTVRPNNEGIAIVDLEEFQNVLAPKALDLNKLFSQLESKIAEKNILGLKVDVTENKELRQPAPEPTQEEDQDVDEDTEDDNQKPKTYPKRNYGYKNGGYKKYSYRNYGYRKSSDNGSTSAKGYKRYNKNSEKK